MTNMSSMPIPRQRKGRIAWTSVKGYPMAEAMPIDIINPRTTLVIPAIASRTLFSTHLRGP